MKADAQAPSAEPNKWWRWWWWLVVVASSLGGVVGDGTIICQQTLRHSADQPRYSTSPATRTAGSPRRREKGSPSRKPSPRAVANYIHTMGRSIDPTYFAGTCQQLTRRFIMHLQQAGCGKTSIMTWFLPLRIASHRIASCLAERTASCPVSRLISPSPGKESI